MKGHTMDKKKIRYIASVSVHKVYKYHKTYVAKVIMCNSTRIESITSDNVFKNKLEALDYAKGMAENIKLLETKNEVQNV
jgi:hypothetical protein